MNKILHQSKTFTLILLLNIAFAYSAPTPPKEIPTGGTALLPSDYIEKLIFQGEEYGKIEAISVEGMPFSKGVRVTVAKQPVKYYHIQCRGNLSGPVKKGETLLVSFYLRNVGKGNNDTGLGHVNIALKSGAELIAKDVMTPGGEWQRYFLPFQAQTSGTEKDANLGFGFGGMLQTIEVGGVEVLNYGTQLKTTDLPQTEVTYNGREADAPWRKEALARIEKNRKGDLLVQVKDASGKDLPNTRVEVKMLKHEFHWGAAVTSRAGVGSKDREIILSKHKELFNQGLPITYFVWNEQETPKGKEGADDILKYFRDNGMATRAHVLVWERADHFPPDVQQMIKNGEKEKLRKRITDYITETVTRYKGRVDEWVVENEAVDNSEIRKVLGEESIAEWFKVARAADPNARLMINENQTDGGKPSKIDRLLGLVKLITDNGGPIDVIGIQGHRGAVPIEPTMMLAHFDRLAATGKRLAITEYDMAAEDEQLKADYTRDFMITIFSHPAFDCLTMWRFWDGQAVKRESVVYANDWTLRPCGQVYKDLVFKEWWTNENGKTDDSGMFKTRGFFGDYEITATTNGKSKTQKISLKKGAPHKTLITLD